MSISVCFSVRPHNSKTTQPNFSPLWRRCDTLCTSGFVDDVVYSRHGTREPESSMTLCLDLGIVTPEFMKVVGVHPFIDQQFSYVRLSAPLLDPARPVLSSVGDKYSVLFYLFIRGHHCYAVRATH